MKKKTENNHYYRLPIDSEAGQKIKALLDRCDEAWRAASLHAQKLGAARFTTNGAFLAGGIGQLYFEHKPNQRAYTVMRRHKGLYECYPNRARHAGHNIFEEIMKLPVVKFSELLPIFGEMKQGDITPAFFDYHEDIYINSETPLQLEGLVESNEAVWEAMKEARRIVKEEESREE